MNVAIIGCGYVGKAAARFWKAAGHSVTATTRNPDHVAELQSIVDHVILLQGNNLSEILAQALVNQEVILLSVAPDDASQYESTYLNTAQALVKAVKRLPMLRQILYTSSTSVYGDQQGQWVDENTPPAPNNDNTKILLATEQILLASQSDNRYVCIFRLGEIIGPGRELSSRLRRLNGQSLSGSGDNYTNLTHIDDIVGAIDFAVSHQLQGVYNLCGDLHILRRDLYHQICEKHGLPHVVWNGSVTSVHGGNKRVSSVKLVAAGYSFYKPLSTVDAVG